MFDCDDVEKLNDYLNSFAKLNSNSDISEFVNKYFEDVSTKDRQNSERNYKEYSIIEGVEFSVGEDKAPSEIDNKIPPHND